MPVQSTNNQTKKKREPKYRLENFLDINYKNWNWMSLMRLNFYDFLAATVSTVFLIIGIVCCVMASSKLGNDSTTATEHLKPNQLNYWHGINGFGGFCLFMGATAWVACLIISSYMYTKARDEDVLDLQWKWIYANFILPWIFTYVTYLIWKRTFDTEIDIATLKKNKDFSLESQIEYQEVQDEEKFLVRKEVQENRAERQEIFQEEKRENKPIKISGKPLTGNKKKRK